MRHLAAERFSHLPHFRGSEFFRIDEGVLRRLESIATHRICGPNEFIYLQDDEAESLFFVRSGHVRLSYLLDDGSPILFGILPAGESFGELGVFEGGCHCDMATSIGTSSIFSVAAPAFRRLCEAHPELAVALGRTVARRYRSYISLTRILGLKTLPARLSQCVLRLADSLDDWTEHGGRRVRRLGAFVTQSDLGLMARGARGNVNRALKAWERDGLIAVRDRSLLVLDRPGLDALALDDDI
ncbi:Crp/Fnr family transcriptional regulator [Antarcticirhabdus aurantiaca]|uniref:Crp/Fnr family transcriptional regulator n=1 Tax=Antarcticirhabdus aurantiaca TaxID=2606717 RepID=A0ACD4NTZ8_9HYPH|nr:Crp/Fnr family transcriptional regulator [Antarcticirhabdus aurantiaca]WAJ30490.1 Crp/Fnr family transcriptional regulator [Jeongeuplla avenae]